MAARCGLEFEDQPLALREGALESFDANGPPAELLHALTLDGQRLLDLALDPALLHGEFGAQVILLRRQLRDRHGKQGFGPAARQALGPGVDGRDDEKRDQGCGDEPQREDHDGFDHADANSKVLDR